MKIFGTGLQRTGTTSLGKALGMLGFAGRDHPWPLWESLDDPMLQRYDAFTDNPIPLLYRQLDARCPGAKFVHTVRDEESWLRSVEWLFTVGAVKFSWHRHPSFHAFHRRLYGSDRFEPERFISAYRQHNRNVLEHFAGRPDDLLVMNVLEGDGFDLLCPFLGVPAPAERFPHWNRREGLWRVRWRKWIGWLRGG